MMKYCWTTIHVRNMEESIAFYQDIVGLTLQRRMEPMPGMEIAFLSFEQGETEVELICSEHNRTPHHSRDISLGFTVNSLEHTREELAAGTSFAIEGPFSPNPRIAFFYITDPNGVRIQFVENR
jgi:lactoylglutathione lyase